MGIEQPMAREASRAGGKKSIQLVACFQTPRAVTLILTTRVGEGTQALHATIDNACNRERKRETRNSDFAPPYVFLRDSSLALSCAVSRGKNIRSRL